MPKLLLSETALLDHQNSLELLGRSIERITQGNMNFFDSDWQRINESKHIISNPETGIYKNIILY